MDRERDSISRFVGLGICLTPTSSLTPPLCGNATPATQTQIPSIAFQYRLHKSPKIRNPI